MEVEIHSDPPAEIPQGASYAEMHRVLSSRERRLDVRVHGEVIYTVRVPTGIFNPSRGVAAQKLIELVFEERVPVKGLDVVDLGCGSGVIGLACILQGAARVLFTDIHPAVVAVAENPMFRHVDDVQVQDLLDGVGDGSQDVVLMSTPSAGLLPPEVRDPGATNVMCHDDFLPRVAREAARVLRPGGALCLWLSMGIERARLEAFLSALYDGFDAESFVVLDPPRERAGKQNWIVLSIRK